MFKTAHELRTTRPKVSSSKQPVDSRKVRGSSRPAAATGAGQADSARKDRALLSTPAARRDCLLPGETGRRKPQQVSGNPSFRYCQRVSEVGEKWGRAARGRGMVGLHEFSPDPLTLCLQATGGEWGADMNSCQVCRKERGNLRGHSLRQLHG